MVIAIIQARMSSKRLPGKVLMTLADGRSILHWCYDNVKKSNVDKVIIATSNRKDDNPIIKECKIIGAEYYRGSLNNVLKRFYKCAKFYKANYIVRITADCPFVSTEGINYLILNKGNYLPTYDILGLQSEIFSMFELTKVFLNPDNKDKEHVTNSMGNKKNHSNKGIRLCVDEISDYVLAYHVSMVINPTKNNIIKLFKKYPGLKNINKTVKQL